MMALFVMAVVRVPDTHVTDIWNKRVSEGQRDPDTIEEKEVANLESEEVRKLGESQMTMSEARDSERINDCLDFRGPIFTLRKGRLWLRVCDMCIHKCAKNFTEREYGLQFLEYDPVRDEWWQVRTEIPWLKNKNVYGVMDYLEDQGWPVPLGNY